MIDEVGNVLSINVWSIW